MMDLEISFDDSPWQRMIDRLNAGDTLSALSFLPLVEEEEEDTILDIFDQLADKGVTLKIEDLPKIPVSGQQAVRLKMEQELAQSENLKEGLSEKDTLRMYLEEVENMVPKTGREELLKKHLAGDKNAAPELLNLCIPQVVDIVKEYTGRGILMMDLIQEGSLGLWQGILRYRDGNFQEHCQWWIRQYIAQAILMQARAGGLGQKLRQGMEDYRDVDDRLLAELGRNPTREEIAEQMHLTPDETFAYESMMEQARSLQQVVKAMKPDAQDDANEEDQEVENTAYFHQRERIMEMLSVLPEQDAQLLTLRFGLEGGLPMSPEDTGEKLGLTPQEVVKREAEALAKLRQEG